MALHEIMSQQMTSVLCEVHSVPGASVFNITQVPGLHCQLESTSSPHLLCSEDVKVADVFEALAIIPP